MEFKALRITALNEKVAANLEILLQDLCGVTEFNIILETQEVTIKFDENLLSFRDLVAEMTKVGCALQHIDAALLL